MGSKESKASENDLIVAAVMAKHLGIRLTCTGARSNIYTWAEMQAVLCKLEGLVGMAAEQNKKLAEQLALLRLALGALKAAKEFLENTGQTTAASGFSEVMEELRKWD